MAYDFRPRTRRLSACGSVNLLKGIKPTPYEFDNGPKFRPPIQVWAQVDHETLSAIVAQLADAERRKLVVRIELRFGGTALPPAKSEHALGESFGVPLDQLNAEDDRTYALQSIELQTTIVKNWRAGQVLGSIDLYRSGTPHYFVGGQLTEARGKIDLERRTVSEINAIVAVRNSISPFRDTEIWVNWKEYERDGISQDYPDRADAGTFTYHAPTTGPHASGRSLSLHLSYTQDDAWNILVPLLLKRPHDLNVELTVCLLVDEATLLASPDQMHGRVEECFLHALREAN